MPLVFRDDPYGGYNFEVIVTGVSDDGGAVKGSFAEASGLEVEVPPIEYRNGSEDITVRKIPGLKKFTNITLKRGLIGDLGFWNWVVEAMNGQVRRTEGSIVLLDETKTEVMRWNFKRGWPCKWTGPGLNAKNNEIAMETLEIAHEGLDIDGQTG
jgi:phage tail-like protein